MRTREDIERDRNDVMLSGNFDPHVRKIVLGGLTVEVLLDIRDLLSK